MLCQLCKKNKATVRIVKIAGDSKTEFNLCSECANTVLGNSISCLSFNQYSLKSILDNLLNASLKKTDRKNVGYLSSNLSCPNCGQTYQEFVGTGKLGCSQCYEYFRKELAPLIGKLQGYSQHVGIVPIAFQERYDRLLGIKKIKDELEQAIIEEEYEKAALLRDKIIEEEKRINDGDSK